MLEYNKHIDIWFYSHSTAGDLKGWHRCPPPCNPLPACLMEVTPLQGDLGHMLLQPHKQDALAVQDLQAPDGLTPPLWEKLNLFQQTAA